MSHRRMVTWTDDQWLELCDMLGIPAVPLDPDDQVESALRVLRTYDHDTHHKRRREVKALLLKALRHLGEGIDE